ncbi:MAG: YbfB/YjiJ family MFS transporter [Zoogloea sp.]|nr:YbfB/YjiJ family MFS transporter [Zoogloea sp.]
MSMATASGRGAALAGAVLLGGTFMGIAGLAQWLARVRDPSATARRIGLITACYGVGQIVGPLVVAGWGRDGDLRLPVLAASVALLLSALLLEVSRRRERLA